MSQGANTTGSAAARRERVEAMTRIFLRPIATPLALGFLALAGATLVLSGLQLGWFAPQESMYVAIALFSFGFPLQLLASIFGFLSRDPVAATGMGILAASWLTVGLVKLNSAPSQTRHVLGVFLVFAGAALLIPALGGAFGKVVPALVLLTAALRFFLTGLYQLTSNTGVEHAAGIVGLILLAVAFYAALALEIEDVRRHTVLRASPGRGEGVDGGQHGRSTHQDRARSRRSRAALRRPQSPSTG